MSLPAHVKATHKAIQTYYQTLKDYREHNVGHETALRSAFQNLLAEIAKTRHWLLVPEQSNRSSGKRVVPDGTLIDDNYLHRGYWEAKDTDDKLEDEIAKKIKKGYPLSNIIFEDTRQAVLFQGKREVLRVDLSEPQNVADLLNQFFDYTEPEIEDFAKAVEEFKDRVPDLARGLAEKIKSAHHDNSRFQTAFASFFDLCQTALNPNISQAAVDEMLVQHLLTERLFRKIFDNPEFTRRNVIAAEVETVIDALVSKNFNRDDFQKSLDRFYVAIENAAHTMPEFGDKQHFLNTVYERFFQGYSVKVADTHGIVYTPQAIVDFMCASVAEVLQSEFGKSLGDAGVNILDPCTGTGNFIVNLLRRIPKRDLPRMYRQQLFANEVMLLPYYIAAMNIEHAYYELTGEYEPFEGLCFVDTLDLAEEKGTFSFMTEKNTERVERQKKTPITVIIGNPPYNVGQLNENDNNKNRQYKVIDERIRRTYADGSNATNKNALSDAYVKFFRWATDRLPEACNGIVCMVSNNGFLMGVAFDGFRKCLAQDFDCIYHFDLKGNARTVGERRRQEGGNIFSDQIRVGVGITLLIRHQQRTPLRIFYHVVGDYWRAEQKTQYLSSLGSLSGVSWKELLPDKRNNWIVSENTDQYESFLAIGADLSKRTTSGIPAIFVIHCRGLETTRDAWVYDFHRETLISKVSGFIETYNSEVDRWNRAKNPKAIDSFVISDDKKIKWSSRLKETLARGVYAEFDESKLRGALYRPFCKQFVFFDPVLNQRQGQFRIIFPTLSQEQENIAIAFTDIGYRAELTSALVTNCITDLHLCASVDAHQCFPFYIYDEDGSNRRENITDWALQQFRQHYGDLPLAPSPTRGEGWGGEASRRKQSPPPQPSPIKGEGEKRPISKWDIFHYVYGLLHHPGYRAKFADNLKRELPRIPFAPDFCAFAAAGAELARLHLDYEKLQPYPLKWLETPDTPLSYYVEDKMRLSKDKTALTVNPSLTLAGIPPETFSYRLGNRSALEWVIDQYQVSEDKRSGIRSDPQPPRRSRIHCPPRRPSGARQHRNCPHRRRSARELQRLNSAISLQLLIPSDSMATLDVTIPTSFPVFLIELR